MKISLATNFDHKLIQELKKYPVYEVYGKFKKDIVGGGRPSDSFANLAKKDFEKHVKEVRNAGVKFNYLLNGGCLSNYETSKEWQVQFRDFLDYLSGVGVNALTVSNPLLLKIIKKYYSCFSVRISIFACVDSLEKALYWEDMGADFICADVLNVNRNFKMLKQIVQGLSSAKIELLANVSCLKSCPMIHTHANWNAHASNTEGSQKSSTDYCILFCQKKELKHPTAYIKSCWIRPEDIHFYEDIGIEHFKLTERNIPTTELVKRLKAYSTRSYEGNLLDLVQGHGFSDKNTKNETDFSKIDFTNLNNKKILKLISEIRGLGEPRQFPQHVYIDNKKLNGFLNFFIKDKCLGNCLSCGYCEKIAEKVISENQEVKKALLFLYDKFENNFI